ncbi:leucine-responsive regulatory protein Lrp [Acidiphilium sp. JA12-A1]|nr:leucine-responsive regulatory protein Lrp [Acidiphilium sp. JA12-A1]
MIAGYTAVVDRQALGLSLTVFVEITVARHSRQNAAIVEESLASIPGLVACHMVSGDADFLVELVVADLKTYERILTENILTIDAVEQVRSNFALRTVLTARPLTLP